MNIYIETSKRIGWEPQPVDIPSIEKAKELLAQIVYYAFEKGRYLFDR